MGWGMGTKACECDVKKCLWLPFLKHICIYLFLKKDQPKELVELLLLYIYQTINANGIIVYFTLLVIYIWFEGDIHAYAYVVHEVLDSQLNA